jgi:menaquinone-dependent protoporphyrinogen oxidase
MHMESTAIVYSTSTGGHVADAAKYIREQTGADTFDLKNQTKIDLTSYERVILGTGVHFGKPYKPLVTWTENNKEVLSKKKVLVMMCCLLKGDKAKSELEKVKAALPLTFELDDGSAFIPDGDQKNDSGVSVCLAEFAEKLKA